MESLELWNPKMYNDSLRNDMMLNQEANTLNKEKTIERHSLWLPKIVSKMQEGSCFMTVGLLHLKYQTVLIQLLGEQGFAVR